MCTDECVYVCVCVCKLFRCTELQQPDPSSLKQQHHLSQIPRERCDDLDLFLFGLDLGNLVPTFRQQSVNFHVLLRMSENDLEKVRRSFPRLLFLFCWSLCACIWVRQLNNNQSLAQISPAVCVLLMCFVY